MTLALFALGALGCFLSASAAVVAVHVLSREVNPISDGISAYGLGRTAPGYRFQAIVSGLGGMALAVALAGRGTASLAIAGVGLYGACRIAIVGYPTDPRGSAITPTGRIHALLAAAAFLALAFAAPVATMTVEVGALPAGSTGLVAALAGLVTITSLGSFAVAAAPRTAAYYGLAQRAYYVASFGWAIAMSLGLLID